MVSGGRWYGGCGSRRRSGRAPSPPCSRYSWAIMPPARPPPTITLSIAHDRPPPCALGFRRTLTTGRPSGVGSHRNVRNATTASTAVAPSSTPMSPSTCVERRARARSCRAGRWPCSRAAAPWRSAAPTSGIADTGKNVPDRNIIGLVIDVGRRRRRSPAWTPSSRSRSPWPGSTGSRPGRPAWPPRRWWRCATPNATRPKTSSTATCISATDQRRGDAGGEELRTAASASV